jgi:hypothetical protein
MTKIRDFIYLDVERLYSLYSQVFEGVADQIVQSYIDSLESKETSKKTPLLRNSDIETKVVEVSRRTENKFLYDHMYNQLEERLSDAIREVAGITQVNYAEITGQAFAIKVTGLAEIEDFQRIKEFISDFNSMGEAIHYITSFDQEKAKATELEIAEFRRRVETTKDRNEKVRAERGLEAAQQKFQHDLRNEALARNLAFDEQYLHHLGYLTDMFYPNRFDITIVPENPNGEVAFRGVLDKKWLRVEPNFMRSLYSGTAHNWTMVGQVTRYPYSPEEAIDFQGKTPQETPSLRDAYQGLIKQGYEVEKTFTVSNTRIELIVSPIAIYRESILPKLMTEE